MKVLLIRLFQCCKMLFQISLQFLPISELKQNTDFKNNTLNIFIVYKFLSFELCLKFFLQVIEMFSIPLIIIA